MLACEALQSEESFKKARASLDAVRAETCLIRSRL